MATHKAPIESHHHIVPIRDYFVVLVLLLILMAITVGVAEVRIPSIGPFSGTVLNQAFALFIAVTKAGLVVSVFMGVRHATQLTKFWALLGFAWLSFFSVMAGDYAMRKYEDVQGWEPSHESALPRTVGASEGIKFTPPANELNVRPRIDR
jgi:caa(3)-type oxidase subunit IV